MTRKIYLCAQLGCECDFELMVRMVVEKAAMRRFGASPMRWFLGGGIFAVAAYVCYAGFTWCRYGQTTRAAKNKKVTLLDEVLPVYEVAEHQQIRVAASADQTFRVACNVRLFNSGLVRAIFRTREFVLGGTSQGRDQKERGLVEQARAWGWSMLAERSGEIVFGAMTQPWVANPVFLGLPRAEFEKFQEPGFVKIAWNLRADPAGPEHSIASTETRVASTDAAARAKFRCYWAFLSPGIILIRHLALRRVRTEAERLKGMPLLPTETAR